ncbi:hypothetical protein KC19_VG199500 [Ceratodon purpureus]|uniref:Uncharacterized protein n=1 Tax=Ceratodon purpureus TaxID=3225 RepID=A0A8T0HSF9_CERPU|nr:hypothetical protein KC19_VG199500 [Ceratodon purpureus]
MLGTKYKHALNGVPRLSHDRKNRGPLGEQELLVRGRDTEPAMGKHTTLCELLEDDDYPPERARKRSRGRKGKRDRRPCPSADKICKDLDDLFNDFVRWHESLNWFSPVVLFLAPRSTPRTLTLWRSPGLRSGDFHSRRECTEPRGPMC